MSKGIRCYDRNPRTVWITCNCDILRDAAHVLEGRNHNFLAKHITDRCKERHPMSDVDVEIPTIDLPFVEQAVALVA